MLVTDVGDEMCWWQLKDVDDRFFHFGHPYPLYSYITVGHQLLVHQLLVTNIQKMSKISKFSHHHPRIVTNITMSPTSLSPNFTIISEFKHQLVQKFIQSSTLDKVTVDDVKNLFKHNIKILEVKQR